MKIFNAQRINKWQVYFMFSIDALYRQRGWYRLEFGIMKLLPAIQRPEREGAQVQRGVDYKGFLINVCFWLPVERG